jgi:hypothetical protein
MSEHQISLGLDAGYQPAPVVVPKLRDEVAAAWGLPLGQRVEICLRGGQRSALTGVLELLSAPDYPWDGRQTLQLGIAGFLFSSREIERWTALWLSRNRGVTEPIEDRGEADKPEESYREFFVTHGDAAKSLNAAEEVFDHMAVTIKLAIKIELNPAASFWWNANQGAGANEGAAKRIGIKAAVSDRPSPIQKRLERSAGTQIVLLAWSETQPDCAAKAIDHCGQLGVQTAFGRSHCLALVAAELRKKWADV